MALCNYPGRNDIGGFIGKTDDYRYASSSTKQTSYGGWTTNRMRGVGLDPDRKGACPTVAWDQGNTYETMFAVRPIRAFA